MNRENTKRADENLGRCPICRQITPPAKTKKLYGQYICKTCHRSYWTRRSSAFIIDWVLLVILWMSSLMAFFSTLPPRETSEGMLAGFMYVFSTYNLGCPPVHFLALTFGDLFIAKIGFLLILLFLVKDGFWGASPGKLFMGLRVINEHTGKSISFTRSFIRNLFILLPITACSFMPLHLSGILILLCLVFVRLSGLGGYRIGDKASGARVVIAKYRHRVPFRVKATRRRRMATRSRDNYDDKDEEYDSVEYYEDDDDDYRT